jgi:hypothetical protein
MTTSDDKQKPPERSGDTRVDLKQSYRKIGISAVAAAVRYRDGAQPETDAQPSRPDRSTARGWSPARN